MLKSIKTCIVTSGQSLGLFSEMLNLFLEVFTEKKPQQYIHVNRSVPKEEHFNCCHMQRFKEHYYTKIFRYFHDAFLCDGTGISDRSVFFLLTDKHMVCYDSLSDFRQKSSPVAFL